MRKFVLSILFTAGLFNVCFAQDVCSADEQSCNTESSALSPASKTAQPFLTLPAPDNTQTPQNKFELVLFYAYDCPHCHKAIEWLSSVVPQYQNLTFSKYEIKRDKKNRELFSKYLEQHNAQPVGVPTFFIGDKMIVGFRESQTPAEIKSELDKLAGADIGSPAADKTITVPFLGAINPRAVSMLQFTFVIGLLDGLNPCAMWVLVFLMGLLIYTKSTKKMALIGGIFVSASALVYFAFMAMWFNFFLVVGYSRWITIALGIVAVVMGLINIKEVFFFKKGVSLMIPESAKPKLTEKIRNIINERKTFAAVIATIALAFFVNLIELGCTIGLPAIFTRVLSIRQTGLAEKYFYMAIYNIAYVVPLAIIVAMFVITMGRYKMTESHAKLLKAASGILMLILGLVMAIKPQLLSL